MLFYLQSTSIGTTTGTYTSQEHIIPTNTL